MASGSSSYRSPATTITLIRKCEESELGKLEKLHRFGPYYHSDEAEVLSRMKDEAWEHVKDKTGGCPLETEEKYMTAVGGSVEEAAKTTYAAGASGIANLEGAEFRRLMVRQGCFFLLMTLAILGADSDELKYCGNNFILGSSLGENDLKRRYWLFYKSIGFPGNQIPLVVLNKLMEQTFFKDVVAAKAKWDKPGQDLVLSVLYDSVLVPALRTAGNTQQISWKNWLISVQRFCFNKLSSAPTSIREQPVDILHGLYLHQVGPEEGGEDDTVERMWEDFEDLESGTGNGIAVEDQETQKIPCAKHLSEAGIRIKSIEGLGIRQIRLRRCMFGAILYLPTLNKNTISMLRYLQDYESIHGLMKREISAYLRFLSDIVCTLEDASLLASQGVLPTDPQLLHMMPQLLKRLAQRDVSNGNFRPSTNLQLVRVHITQYTQRPRYGKYFGAIGILTLIAAIFAVLQYFKKDSH